MPTKREIQLAKEIKIAQELRRQEIRDARATKLGGYGMTIGSQNKRFLTEDEKQTIQNKQDQIIKILTKLGGDKAVMWIGALATQNENTAIKALDDMGGETAYRRIGWMISDNPERADKIVAAIRSENIPNIRAALEKAVNSVPDLLEKEEIKTAMSQLDFKP